MLIAELTGLNIVVTPEVQDTITANLENVSVKAALDVILIPPLQLIFLELLSLVLIF